MRDFPMFTTELGVASLVLSQIPYTKTAYIRIQDSQEPEAFARECADFCLAAGAQTVYAQGEGLSTESEDCVSVLKLQADPQQLPDTDASLFPVQKNTLSRWREIYNKKMLHIPNASYMTLAGAEQMLGRGEAYFIHRGGTLLGIGAVSGESIEALASCSQGAGKDVVCALSHALSGNRVVLEVASVNRKAMALYRDLGFVPVAELSRWVPVIKK